MSQLVYHCSDGATVEGPVPIDRIRQLLASKAISLATLLSLGGEERWKAVDEFFEDHFPSRTPTTIADRVKRADPDEMSPKLMLLHLVIGPAVDFQFPPQAAIMGYGTSTHPDNLHWEIAVFLISQADYFLDCKHKQRRMLVMAIVLEEFTEFAPHLPVDQYVIEDIFNERLAMYGDLSRERAGIEAQLDALTLAICMTIEADKPVEGVHGVAELERKGSTTKKRGNLPIQTHMLKPLIMMELIDSLLKSGKLPAVLGKLDEFCQRLSAK
jgi:hypothetical protein